MALAAHVLEANPMKTLITALALSLPLAGFAQTATEKAGSDAKSSADKAAADTNAAASHTKNTAKHAAKKTTDAAHAAGDTMAK